MISSAVVIPEEQPPVPSSSPNLLKRRQSSFTADSNKRPRIETQGSLENGSAADQASPDRPKPPSAIEEKKRGKRLFGALLGTLSQTSSKPAHRKRDEIEQRQRERFRKDSEQREQAAKRKKEEIDQARRIEQKAWNAESTRLQHANMRATANFLRTKTEPRLYYKPWDLRPEEESQIKKQIAEVEDTIQREPYGGKQETDYDETNRLTDPANGDIGHASSEGNASRNDGHEKTDLAGENSLAGQTLIPQQTPAEESAEIKTDQQKEDDHGGGELVEGREDDIMY